MGTLCLSLFLYYFYIILNYLYIFSIILYYLCIKCTICTVVYLSLLCINSPSVPAGWWRRIPVDRSARGVNDSYCSGSAHGVPMLLRCRRWQSMAVRVLNSPEQLMHLNPSACGAFAFEGALSPVWHAETRGGVHYAVQVQAPSQLLGNYGGLPRFTPSNYKI